MTKQKQLSIRLNEDLYEQAMEKCHKNFGIGLSPLIKIFLKSFVSQNGVGFYVGNDDLCKMFSKWLQKKSLEHIHEGSNHLYSPRLKDLYDLNLKKKS